MKAIPNPVPRLTQLTRLAGRSLASLLVDYSAWFAEVFNHLVMNRLRDDSGQGMMLAKVPVQRR